MRLVWLLLAVALGWHAIAGPAAAQSGKLELLQSGGETAGEGPQDALQSPEAVRAMVARLSDEQVREILLARLEAEAAAEETGPDGLTAATDIALTAAGGLGEAFAWAWRATPNLADGIGLALSRFAEPRGALGILRVIAVAIAAGLVGWLAAMLVWRAAAELIRDRAPMKARELNETAPLSHLAARIGLRLAVALAGAAAALGAAWAAIWLATGAYGDPAVPSDYLVLWFLLKEPAVYTVVVAAIAWVLLSPGDATRRLIHMDDRNARVLWLGLVVFALIAGMRSYLLSFLGGHGVDLASVRLGFWMSLAMYGWLFWLAWRAREGLASSLIGEGDDTTPAERRFARAYPYTAMGLIAFFWLLTEIFVGTGQFQLLDGRLPMTLLILIFAPAADRVIRALVYRVRPPEEGQGAAAEAAFAKTRRGYIRIGRVVLAGLVIWILSAIWDFSFAEMAGAGIGVRFAGRLLEAVLVVGVGYVLLEGISIWINGMLAREKGPELDEEEPGGGEGGGSGGSRLATVLPLVSMALQGAIVAMTLLTALSALGVDTTPLLAGAGIVGIAIGFGAQALVADIVSGIFFLIDDAFRTGEYVEVEGTVGTVEKISVRSMRLRHHEGRVHTIPYGQIPKLTNYSRDWVIMKLRFTVPFDSDLEKIRKLFKKIGQQMMEEERFAEDFLQPFKSQGVIEVDDVGIVIRGKFMAKPGRQWTLRKEIYARVQRAFEENGLQFARKEVRVKIDTDPDHLTEDQKRQVAAAAAEASQQPPPSGEAAGDAPEPR